MLYTRHNIPQRELALDNLYLADYEPEEAYRMAFDCRDNLYSCSNLFICSYCKDKVPLCYFDQQSKLCNNCS